MDSVRRKVLVVGWLAAAASAACAAGDDWNATFDTGPRFANEALIELEPSGLVLSTTPRSKTLFGGLVGRGIGSSPLEVGRVPVDGLGSERLGWNVGAGLEPDVGSQGLMANQYFDFRSSSRFTPTIGGGIGVSNVPGIVPGTPGYSGAAEDYPVFMFSFEASLGYEFSESVRGSLGYRLLGSQQNELSDSLSVPFTNEWAQEQSVEIGVRIDF
ncbi:MAG: hypothetical protein R3286_09210 [Gammaproteobacteria bacterium]|nr:hypothetical protein [Gammaproteobacteria bacterium]